MYFLAQIDQLLSLTGVIATILSVIFGIAAFYNSRTRKKHLIEFENAQKRENRMHFRPAKSTPPTARSSLPSRSTSPPHETSSAPKAAPVAKSFSDEEIPSVQPKETSEPKAPAKEAPQLFRKVNPSGGTHRDEDAETHDRESYVWE